MSDSWWSWPGNVTLILWAPHKSSVTSLPKSPQKSLSLVGVRCESLVGSWAPYDGMAGMVIFWPPATTVIQLMPLAKLRLLWLLLANGAQPMLRVALLFFGLTQSNLNCDQESPSGGKHPQKNEPRFFLPELPASRMRASNMLIEIQVSGLIKNCYSHHIKWH